MKVVVMMMMTMMKVEENELINYNYQCWDMYEYNCWSKDCCNNNNNLLVETPSIVDEVNNDYDNIYNWAA